MSNRDRKLYLNDKVLELHYAGIDGGIVSAEVDIDEPETGPSHCAVRGFDTSG